MRRIGTGDTGAFRQIMTEHGPRLIRLAYGVTGRLDEAEDIAQEALLTLWRTAPDWQAKATIAAYLRTVATRKAIDVLRQRKFQVDDYQLDELHDPGQGPLVDLERSQDMTQLLEQLAQMPERQRAALVLAHFENRSHREAAEIMEIDVEAYSSLLARARRALRRKIEQSQQEEGGGKRDEQQI
ncbi:RNA polymerase sigma factor [Hoeflea sp. TYP-13]|uniref:RNA polymerase sigma factor n=1 Tax=Hoeflea sp. TYP-13 TaxID=3230023 RepID=UPI0034C5F3EB